MNFDKFSKDIGLDGKTVSKLLGAVSNEKALSFKDTFGDLMGSLLNP
ncbi:MAG: hypothetical protein JRJ57_07485 [Deltaproteobacteria bacterium]|nr:hypothetical protein [Deltaproteobacteria bacterium]